MPERSLALPVIAGLVAGVLTMLVIALVGDLTLIGFLAALMVAAAAGGGVMYRDLDRKA